MIIDSLYGKTGHIKINGHLEKEENYIKKKEEEKSGADQIDTDPKILKLFEYDMCNLFINLNLLLMDVEPILKLLKKTFKIISNKKFQT